MVVESEYARSGSFLPQAPLLNPSTLAELATAAVAGVGHFLSDQISPAAQPFM